VWIRRARRLAFLASIGMGVYRWWLQKGPGRPGGGGGGGSGRPAPAGGPKSPPAMRAAKTPEPEPEVVGAASAPRTVASSTAGTASGDVSEARAWVEPLDGGACPASHPVKANDHSGIFHVPGGRFYDRTVAVRCYAGPESATADGYRPAKA
jgi:hypothetical protein